MEAFKLQHVKQDGIDLATIDPNVTEWDQQAFLRIVSTDLTPEQKARIVEPPVVHAKQNAVVAVHWHPEFVPMELIMQRVDRMFPNRRAELIIPTQHNVLLPLDGYAGVEIDCYSTGFNRKVQLLTHFAASRVEQADVFEAMLAHTFKYRASQLFEFIDSILDPVFQDRVDRAAKKTGASDDLVRFMRIHVSKVKQLIDRNEGVTPPDMVKNKLLRNYFNALRDHYDESLIHRAQVFLQAIKKIVKYGFKLTYFYRTEEVIEEVRALGGAIVIPHPEQFWPILLADYDVDGIEVWNPQSQEYTEFLINVVHRENKKRRTGERPLLIFMGDDTHFGEKVIDPDRQDPEKAGRQLGVQSAWDDLSIRKSLIIAHADRPNLIAEYKSRLS